MSLLPRARLAIASALPLAVLFFVATAAPAQDEDKPEKGKPVVFKTVDYVELKGKLWTNPKGKKNACVILLHNFNKKTGGNRNDDGWNDLAVALVKEGYTVLSFDFRGHGESTAVSKEFWDPKKFPQNQMLLRGKVIKNIDDYPTKIDYKAFPPNQNYYPHLVDDISAAKAYLDSKVGVAAGNTIVIGAGEGATLGAMWMSQEYRRYREKTENVMGRMTPNPESDPEGKDLVCGIWLSMSNSINNHPLGGTLLYSWLDEVGGKRNQVPMLFIYGKDEPDNRSKTVSRVALQKMVLGYQMMEGAEGWPKDEKYKFTRDFQVDTKLEGSQLLQDSLPTTDFIKNYINKVNDARNPAERKRHEAEKYRFFWIAPGSSTPLIGKAVGEEFMQPIPLKTMGLGN